MPTTTPRRAVTALFLTNGALFATVLPRLPEIKDELDLSAGTLGLALLGVGLGGLAGSAASRWLLPSLGSGRLAVGAMLVLAGAVPLIAVAPAAVVLFAVLAVVGIADALADVAMNVSGLAVQRSLGRPILSGLHATWSIGAVFGGAIGTAAAALGIPLLVHLVVVALAFAVLVLAIAAAVPSRSGVGTGTHAAHRRIPAALLLLCGLAVLAALVEDSPSSWSAIYLRDVLGAPPGVAGLGYTAFMAAMVVGRLVGDRLVAALGLVGVVRVGGGVAALGFAVLALIRDADFAIPAAVATFAAIGFALAAMFPALFTAADALPGQGVAVMNAASRIGFLAAPPLVGLLADAVGLGVALGVLIAPAALGIALLANAVRPPRVVATGAG